MLLKGLLQQAAFTAFLIAVLFGSAGTLAWPQGWAYLVLFAGCSQAMGVWLMRADPELLQRRMQPPLDSAQAPRDRVIVIAILVAMFAWTVFMPLDARRFHWSSTPLWAQIVGGVLVVMAFWAWSRVLAANSFAATTIAAQAGQQVISTGPYAIVRHPMYADCLLLFVGAPLLLGSLWGLLAIPLIMPLLGLRAAGEEAMLLHTLPGYRDYMAKVRWRLAPGVW